MRNIDRVRRFNRTVTQQIGALQSQFLGRGRPLGASRMLFEIGAGGAEIRGLRARLGLDSGYTSRLLRSLEAERLVQVGRAPGDARVRFATLTDRGREELAELNCLSDESAGALLEPLSARQRAALTDAMDTVERLLRAGAVRIATEDPSSRAARQCLEAYYRELATRFEGGFDHRASISATPEELTPPRGYFVVARLHDEPVGCGALKCLSEHGEIKRMWVAEASRGLGTGRRILAELEAIARQRGLPVLRLETNKSLIEAQALYRSSGYREVPAFNDEHFAHHWFEKHL